MSRTVRSDWQENEMNERNERHEHGRQVDGHWHLLAQFPLPFQLLLAAMLNVCLLDPHQAYWASAFMMVSLCAW